MKDAELLKKLHNDPNSGMKILLGQYAGLVYAVIKSKLPGYAAEDIEDCVSDTFSEFWRDFGKYDPSSGSIRSWLCVIAKNNAVDFVRKKIRRSAETHIDDADVKEQCDDSASVEDIFEDTERRGELVRAVRRLGRTDREIIIRKFYFSQSSKEIAKAMKMSVSNVDTRTHRALKKLRKIIGDE